MRSLWLNFEVTLVISDPTFCREMGELIDQYNAESDTLDYIRWEKRSGWRKVLEGLARLVSPLL